MGVAGLQNKVRKDRGGSQVPDVLREALFRLRKEHPLYTVKRLLKELLEDDLWDGRKPSRTALYRFTASHGLNRQVQNIPDSVRPFEYPHFGDLWGADFLHGPKVKEGVYEKKTYLHVILDDATRYIVAANFHLAENTESMLSDLMLSIRKYGIPLRYYTDNGSALISQDFGDYLEERGIGHIFASPYHPQTNGKIERFWKIVYDECLRCQRTAKTKDELIAEINGFLYRYNYQRRHSGLNYQTPLEKLQHVANMLPKC